MPGLERALAVLQLLAGHPAGLTAAELGAASAVPKATLYRILRILRSHALLAPAATDASRWTLGPGLVRLAQQVPRAHDWVTTARPWMDRLCEDIGETVKLVVREGEEAMTLAVAHPKRDSRIASRVGNRLPLVLGASQRLLLAHAPSDVIDAVLGRRLARHASRTLTSAASIRRRFAEARRTRVATSHSEGVEGVGAFAAAVPGPDGAVSAALVAIYVHAGKTLEERRRIARLTTAAAGSLAVALALEP